jgi:hypothetical protein
MSCCEVATRLQQTHRCYKTKSESESVTPAGFADSTRPFLDLFCRRFRQIINAMMANKTIIPPAETPVANLFGRGQPHRDVMNDESAYLTAGHFLCDQNENSKRGSEERVRGLVILFRRGWPRCER